MKTVLSLLAGLVFLLLQPSLSLGEDVVEFMSGVKATGSVKTIRKTEQEFEFEAKVAGRNLVRTYAFGEVHAVTLSGKRHILTEHPSHKGDDTQHTKQEILEMIKTVGSTPPDWYDETPLDCPDTLDLSWPLKPPTKGWKNKVNVGQYLWDIINPNTGRWQSGVKLIHHMMTLHQDDQERLDRDMQILGKMYFNLFQDYPRAAFWFTQAKRSNPPSKKVFLAECYWRLGSEEMALELLRGSDLPVQGIKLLGDLGQTDRAISLTNRYANSNQSHVALLLGGDACRSAGRMDEAVKFYQRVLSSGDARNKEYSARYRGRATDSIEAIRLSEKARADSVADGTYRDKSVGYNGPVEIEVSVADGKIASLRVSNHQEKQFYAALTDTPDQIIKKQSVQEIDGTSGATITSLAIVNATAKALASGAK